MQSTVAIKAYSKRIFLKNAIVPGRAYTTKTFRFEFLINPLFMIYLIGLIFFLFFSKINFYYVVPLLFYFLILLIESIRISNFTLNFINLFFKLFIATIIQSIASLLLFFNLSIDLKKHYRNVSDDYQ